MKKDRYLELNDSLSHRSLYGWGGCGRLHIWQRKLTNMPAVISKDTCSQTSVNKMMCIKKTFRAPPWKKTILGNSIQLGGYIINFRNVLPKIGKCLSWRASVQVCKGLGSFLCTSVVPYTDKSKGIWAVIYATKPKLTGSLYEIGALQNHLHEQATTVVNHFQRIHMCN